MSAICWTWIKDVRLNFQVATVSKGNSICSLVLVTFSIAVPSAPLSGFLACPPGQIAKGQQAVSKASAGV